MSEVTYHITGWAGVIVGTVVFGWLIAWLFVLPTIGMLWLFGWLS
jgi:hypothetical protein